MFRLFQSVTTWNFEPMSYLWNLLSVIICGWRVSVWSSFSGVMWVYWKIKPKAKNVQILLKFAVFSLHHWPGVVSGGGGRGGDEGWGLRWETYRMAAFFSTNMMWFNLFCVMWHKGMTTYICTWLQKRSNWKFCVLVRHQESFKCLLLCEITVTKLSDWYSMVLINLPEL